MTDLPLIEVKEVYPLPDQWKQQLEKAVNQEGREKSFDSSIRIKNTGPELPFTCK